MIEVREYRHAHLCGAIGGGAKGFNRARPRLGNRVAKFRCIGSIDVDAAANRDFARMVGVPATTLDLFDLFDREQYVAFHGHEPPAGWREAVPADIHRAFGYEQAMYLMLRDLVPRAQLVLVHADLGDVEWPGAADHIRATTAGEPLHVCRSRRTLLQMIEERGMFPSPKQRQCTSDLKRGPIERTIRGLGAKLVVNCMGMRAEESSGRAKLLPFKLNLRNSVAGREWYDWLPIHDLSTEGVFARIAAAGQQPHPIYAAGMSRFSCCFCIMASRADLTTAARLNPSLYRRYVELERSTGQVMLMPSKQHGRQTLEQVTGVPA